MKITIGRKDLIAAGNKAQLMPMTDDGWVHLANVALADMFPAYKFTSINRVNFRKDGCIKNVTFSNMVKE